MRSLRRNSWPTNPDGSDKKPNNYSEFLNDLKNNFGNYCCYCEDRCRSVDIEHVAPKSLNEALACDWNNLLLACPKCNRDYKKSWNQNRSNYIWPDTSDTFLIFRYHVDGSMSVAQGVSPVIEQEALNTIGLMHLNPVGASNDDLCEMRKEQWQIASDFLDDFEQGRLSVERVVKNVVANGYWSVWMTVFEKHPEVTKKISDAFPGTLPKYCSP